MIDWFWSKMAMTFVVIALVGAAFTYFQNFTENVDFNELGNIAIRIKSTVDDINALNAEASLNVTFQYDRPGLYLPQTVNDRPYTITISLNFVQVSQRGYKKSAWFIQPIHIGTKNDICSDGECTEDDIAAHDAHNSYIEFTSGTDFVIARNKLVVNGEEQLHTFIYKR